MGLFDKIFGKKVAEQIEENASADIFKFDLTEKEATTDAETAPESKSVIVSEPISEIEIEPKSVSEKEIETIEVVAETADVKVEAELKPEIEPETPKQIEEKYEKSLKKTSKSFGARFNEFLANFRSVDEAFFEDLEDTLIMSDVGVDVATQLTDDLRREVKLQNVKSKDEVKRVIIEKMVDNFGESGLNTRLNLQDGLTVMLFVGVNGVGKTTTIGKLANRYKHEGKKVLLAAADTFRAGARDQLVEWARRSGVDVVVGKENSDPASVVFDAVKRANTEQFDVLLIDTAGRLQNKDNLMKELEKMGKIIKRELPDAPHETLLALDATTGQNAISQVKAFKEEADLTGLVITKLDGTAKGGVAIGIVEENKIPIKFIGVGEQIDDMEIFNSEDFVKAII